MIEFKYDEEVDGITVVMSTHSPMLDELIDLFERFLLACGWGLPEGVHIGYENSNDFCGQDSQIVDNPAVPDNGVTNPPQLGVSDKGSIGSPDSENADPETASETTLKPEGTKSVSTITPEEVVMALNYCEDTYDPKASFENLDGEARILAAAVRELAWAAHNGVSSDADWRRWDDAVAIADAVEEMKG